jgi:hypothetical protein
LLGLFVGLALPSSAAHRAAHRSDGRALACITDDTPDDRPSDSTSRCPTRSSSLGLWRVRGSLLFGSLYVCCGRAGWCRSVWVYSGLLLDLGVAAILVSELLVVGRIVLGIPEHPDLLRRGKGGRRRSRGSRWRSSRGGTAGIRSFARYRQPVRAAVFEPTSFWCVEKPFALQHDEPEECALHEGDEVGRLTANLEVNVPSRPVAYGHIGMLMGTRTRKQLSFVTGCSTTPI